MSQAHPVVPVSSVDLARHYRRFRDELDEAYERVMSRGIFIMGEELERFESEFAAYCGAAHCVGVGNGLDALALTLEAYGVGPGDEVIVPGYTFIATFLAVTRVGAIAVPVDVIDSTYNLDPGVVSGAVSPATKAIIPVHLFGQPAEMEHLREVARPKDLKVIEDAAQAHGAMFRATRAGAIGDAAAFSFYPVKNLGAFGDGGAITTSDDDLAARLRRTRNYGSATKYVHAEIGTNSRLDELQAALLRVNLSHLDELNEARTRLAERYSAELAECEPAVRLPAVDAPTRSVWHQYVIVVDDRDGLQRHLVDRSIHTLVHYPVPPHLQEAYSSNPGLIRRPMPLPVTERLAQTSLSLPIHPWLEFEEQTAVIEAVRSFVERPSPKKFVAPAPRSDSRRTRIDAYTREYLADYGFESDLVAARHEIALELLESVKPKTVVEVGCGAELLYSKAVARGLPIESWIIVEPSDEFAERARKSAVGAIALHVIEGFFEDVAPEIARLAVAPIDALLISGLLQELDDPEGALRLAKQLLERGGVLHVTVANAGSLHRRLALAMGLISSLDELSHRNRTLAQPRVYDRNSIREAVVGAGFVVDSEGGYFMKPFTNDQMASVAHVLPASLNHGLMQLGREYPELASEVFVNARVVRS